MVRLDRRTMKKLLPALFLFAFRSVWAQPASADLASIILPADGPAFELISFQADPVEEGIAVHWTTAHEKPGGAFLVERSGDRMNWEAVATEVVRGGQRDRTPYELIDHTSKHGILYYRLKLMRNGEEEVVSDDFGVERKAAQDLLIEGDRASRQFTVLGHGSISDLQVLNNRGQFITMEVDYQGDRVRVNGEHLEPGTYFVQAIVDGIPVLKQLTVTATAVLGG